MKNKNFLMAYSVNIGYIVFVIFSLIIPVYFIYNSVIEIYYRHTFVRIFNSILYMLIIITSLFNVIFTLKILFMIRTCENYKINNLYKIKHIISLAIPIILVIILIIYYLYTFHYVGI
jgi:hypothetical protein